VRLLLDESLPRRLARHLTTEKVDTVYDRQWSGFKNGELLRAAESEYDVFLTADQNLEYQQNLRGFAIGVVVVAARTNRIEDLLPLVPELASACAAVRHGEVVRVRAKAGSGGA
jgi:predicted nuclease of predicted toxin-antitoxin system